MSADPERWTPAEREHAALARRALSEVVEGERSASSTEVFADDVVLHFLGTGSEQSSVRATAADVPDPWEAFREGFPDLEVGVDHLLVDGDRVVAWITARATHTGEFRGFAPTGRRFEIPGVIVFRVADGQIVEQWNLVHALGMLQQLDLFPDSPADVAKLLYGKLRQRLDPGSRSRREE